MCYNHLHVGIRRVIACLSLLAVVTLTPITQWTFAADTLRVMTFNIHHGRGLDDVVDIERIADVIVLHQPDIVGLQEVDVGVERSGGIDIVAVLGRLTGLSHTAFGRNLDLQGGGYGNAVLSRYPIVSGHNIRLRQLGPGEQRGVQVVTVQRNRVPVTVLNTHLDHLADNDERMYSFRQVRDEIMPDLADGCVILTADLNDVADSAVYRAFTSLLSDAWSPGNGPGDTFPADTPERRIDYVMLGEGLSAVAAFVPETEASDHRPVVAYLTGCTD